MLLHRVCRTGRLLRARRCLIVRLRGRKLPSHPAVCSWGNWSCLDSLQLARRVPERREGWPSEGSGAG